MTADPSASLPLPLPSELATAHHSLPAAALASWLADRHALGRGTTVTWLNHHSALRCLAETPAPLLPSFDVVGVDGLLLRRMLGGGPRTSADLTVPFLLGAAAGARVASIGAAPSLQPRIAAALSALCHPTARVVTTLDGYGHDVTDPRFGAGLDDFDPTVVLVGLGPVKQELFARRIADRLPRAQVLTVGGYLDQVVVEGGYYPAWAYPLRLNWAVRVAREPGRLWRRYTVDTARALAASAQLRGLHGLEGLRHHDRLASDDVAA